MTEQKRKQPLIVGITGKAGAGKDTLANYLLEQLFEIGIRAQVVRLADPLKEAYSALFCLNREDLEHFDFKNQVNKFTGNTHRQELQFLGTEAYRVRTNNPDVWVQVLSEKVSKLDVQVVIVPDVRFDNEAEFVLSRGFLVGVKRNSELKTDSNHASEAGVALPLTWQVNNDSTLGHLEWSSKFLREKVVQALIG